MRCPDTIPNDSERLMALAEYGLSAEVTLPSLDPIVEMAVRLFDMPASAVNMIGSDHVFFAASAGIGEADMRRDVSFCAHAITQDEVMVVEDATLDERFHDNPIVEAGLIRFYAGIPLKAPSGHALGALCVLDSKPHFDFTDEDRARLRDLAVIAAEKLELRRLAVAKDAQPSRLEASAATSPNAVLCFDRDCRITAWNTAAAALFGYAAEEVIGQSVTMLVPQKGWNDVLGAVARMVVGDGDPPAERMGVVGLRKDGSRFSAELSWSQSRDGPEPQFGAIIQAIEKPRHNEEALYRLANYDSLTGLPNRTLFHLRVEAALTSRGKAALVVIDIDRFKIINDTLGEAMGDLVLNMIAERLRNSVPRMSTVARIGGDEFAVMLHDMADPLLLAAASDRIIAAIRDPIPILGHELSLSATCGLAITPENGKTVASLIGSAEHALSQAKSNGRGQSLLYTRI